FATIPAARTVETPLRPAEKPPVPRYAWIQGELFGETFGPVAPPGLARPAALAGGGWGAEQERALASKTELERVRHEQLEAERIRALLEAEVPWSREMAQVSSPSGGEGQKPFWLNLDAELVVYGGTEPNARVTIEGEPIS